MIYRVVRSSSQPARRRPSLAGVLVAALGVGACATGERLEPGGERRNFAADAVASGATTSTGGVAQTGGGPSSGGAVMGGSGGAATAGAGGAVMAGAGGATATGGNSGTGGNGGNGGNGGSSTLDGGSSTLDGGPAPDASRDGGSAGSGTGGAGGTGGGTCSGSINIRNDVMDARDRLHIRATEMWWEHFTPGEFPGEHNNRNAPSHVTSDQAGSANASVTWCPVFGGCNVCNSSCSPSAISSVPFVLSPPQFPLPGGDLVVTLTVTTGRNAVTIVQQPSVANSGELIIEFNDTSSGASAYNVTASYTSASPCSG